MFAAIRGLAEARRSLLALRSGGSTELLPTENRSVLAYRRAHPRSAPFLSLTNFSDITQSVDAGIIARAGLHDPAHVHSTTGKLPSRAAGSSCRPGASSGSPAPEPPRAPRIARTDQARRRDLVDGNAAPHHRGEWTTRNLGPSTRRAGYPHPPARRAWRLTPGSVPGLRCAPKLWL